MLGKVIYWLAVLAVSIALVIALILWFESQDESRIEGTWTPPAGMSRGDDRPPYMWVIVIS